MSVATLSFVTCGWTVRAVAQPRDDSLDALERRVDALEARLSDDRGEDAAGEVDLTPRSVPAEELLLHGDGEPSHPLARAWFQRFHFGAFGAFDFLVTGADGKHPDGGFIVKETSLFVEADVWTDVSFFVEIQTNRLGKDDSLFVRTGEVHAHFRNVLRAWGDDLLGIKIGRIDIPFGEEYLWQDAPDNPLITNSAPYPYGWDEGILFYGSIGSRSGWVAAVMDGTDERSIEDNFDKAVAIKIHAQPSDGLYLSLSAMRNGRAGKSAIEFGGSHFEPVGASHPSSIGSSPSSKVDGYLYELDAKYDLSTDAYVSASFGQAFVDDRASAFDRDFLWFTLEALYRFHSNAYFVGRYSEIGTYSSTEGYHFDGKITAGGNAAFGYDARRFRRLSVGLGWNPFPGVLIKAEGGADWFDVIDASALPDSDERFLAGIEVVISL